MKRVLMLTLAVACVLFATATSAFAWANGADTDGDGAGDNGYGTHDWVIDEAIRLAGPSASWLETETAMFATDDPDTMIRDVNNHFYDDTRKGQGAPQRVADLYDRVVAEYQAGDYAAASRDFGLLSHYYADICQPFHTLWYADEDLEHVAYEGVVNSHTNTPGENEDWIAVRSRSSVTDVREMTLSAGLAARKDYYSLRSAFVPADEDGNASNFDPSATSATGAITRRRLSRAVNDLADMLVAIPTGQGRSAAAVVTSTKITRRYVGTASAVTANATVTNTSGRPLRGIRVNFNYAVSSGLLRFVAYTDANGRASITADLPNEPQWYRVNIAAVTTTNGVNSQKSTWVMTTPKVASMKTTVSSAKPKQGSKVTVTTRLLASNGVPIGNLPVTVTWRFKTKTYRYSMVTDAAGYVRTSRNIGKASTKYRAQVTTYAQCANTSYSSTGRFLPQKPKPKKSAKKR